MKSLGLLFQSVGQWAHFVTVCFRLLVSDGISGREFKKQVLRVGIQSVPLTCAAGFFVGAILAIQIDSQIRDFGAQSYLGGISVSTTLRNLGPVLIAFFLAGRVGAFTSAELGTMSITDQLNAIRCLGLNPIREIVIPRLLAVAVSSVFLLLMGLLMSVFGGISIASIGLQVNPLQFVHRVPEFLALSSMVLALIKSIVFGLMIGSVSCFIGVHISGGAEEVGGGVRRTAVVLVVGIIILDFMISWMGSQFLSLSQW